MLLVIDGCHFQLKNLNSKKTIQFWRCADSDCGVLMHTTLDDEFIRYAGKATGHSHLSNPAESAIRNLREKMRGRAKNPFLPLQEIAEQEVRNALLTGEALAALPGATNIGHNVVGNRRKMTPALPQSSTFTIPNAYTMDYRNDK